MRKYLLTLVAAAGIAAATVMTAGAEARCYGCYVGAGVAVGLLAGAAFAHGYGYPYYGYGPVYYGPPYAYYGPRYYYRPRHYGYHGPHSYYGPRYRYYGARYYYARPYRYYYW